MKHNYMKELFYILIIVFIFFLVDEFYLYLVGK